MWDLFGPTCIFILVNSLGRRSHVQYSLIGPKLSSSATPPGLTSKNFFYCVFDLCLLLKQNLEFFEQSDKKMSPIWPTEVLHVFHLRIQAVGGRPPRYAPAPLSFCGRRSASRRRADRRACRRQRSSRFPRWILSYGDRCSCLVYKRRGESSGLVTLTFDLLTLKMVSESRVTWATSVPILVFLGLSVLDVGEMYATDRRQTASSLNAAAY